MTCAVVEHQNGKKTHHTNVNSCSVGMSRNVPRVSLMLSDGSKRVIQGAVSARLVDDTWYAMNASGLVPQ